MDFIDWCSRVLTAMADVTRASPQARSMGMRDLELAAAIFGNDAVYGPSGFRGSERHAAVHDALRELHRAGVVEQPTQSWWRLGPTGEQVLADEVSLWRTLVQPDLELTPERRQLLEVVNRLSTRQADDYAWLVWISDELLPELNWPGGMALLHAIAGELEERGLVARHPAMGSERLHSTYQGLVWSTRRHLIQSSDAAAGPPITPRQQRLLFNLVDWSRIDPEGRDLQYYEFDQTSYFAGHPGHVERSDVQQLAEKGYLHTYQIVPGRGITFVSVTAEGHAYYEAHQREHQPAEQLVTRVREYVETTAIAAYPEAAQRLQEAANELWSARRDADVTPVGFKCREAMQSFAQAYYARFYPAATIDPPIAKERTADLVSKVIRHLQQARGETDTSFDDALFWFWRRLIDLDQKVVHDTTTPAHPLTWEHGRRVLLYSYLLIGELHLLATSGRT